jgi:hypothetical protein
MKAAASNLLSNHLDPRQSSVDQASMRAAGLGA